jgi:hypothetical protein
LDRSACKRIVECEIVGLLEACGVPHWHVEVVYGPIGGNAVGECERLLDYESAEIRIDPERIDDEEHLLKVLRHETFHIVLAPFDLLRTWIEAGLDGAELEKVQRVVRHAEETAVKALSRMWWGCEKHWAAKAEAAAAGKPENGPKVPKKKKKSS